MEIFLMYNSFFTVGGITLAEFDLSLTSLHFISLGVGACIWLAFFLMQGFGLWKMAKKRDLPKRWMAFVPFANFLYMGKLAGDCNMFGQKVKRLGLFAMIAQIITTVFSLLLLASISYLFLVEGEPSIVEDSLGSGIPYWGGTGFSKTVEDFYRIGAGYSFGISILSILQLVYEILLMMLCMGLYRRYTPKSYTWLSLLVIFVPMSRYIITFCLRNRQSIDWEAYMRARNEAFARQYQQQYGGYNNGGYGSGQSNPYGNGTPYGNPNGQPTPPKPEEPFGEFGGKEDGEKPFEEFGENNALTTDTKDDDFFN